MSGGSLPVRGACYGYAIRSEVDLAYLRTGGGEPLDVFVDDLSGPPGEILREWEPPLFPRRVRLHADGDGYRLWYEDGGWMGIQPGSRRLAIPADMDPIRREECLWGVPILLCFLTRGDVPLHAACVEIDGRALLLAAPGKLGKTTLAMAFAASGYRVLAEDLVCLRPGETPSVVPGPAMLRIRRDMADAFSVPGAIELRRDEERAHLALRRGRGTCEPVPVSAVVLLHEGDTDPRVEATAGAEVVRDLWAVSFNLPNDADRARCFRAVARLESMIPAWNLTRRLRIEDLRPTVDCLVEVATGRV